MNALLQEMDALTRKPELTKEDRARLDFLLAANKTGKNNKRSLTPEMRAWKKYIVNGEVGEYRSTVFESGKGDITSSVGSAGGYLVPAQFNKMVYEAAAQTDPLLSEQNVGLIQENNIGFSLPPKQIVGWDLSSITSVQISENTLQSPATVPTVAGDTLNGYLHRLSLAGTFEFEDDAFMSAIELMARAFGVGFARGIGATLATGNGSGAPEGLLTGAANSGVTTAGSGAITLADIESIYFSLNRIYRASPKCAWVISDGVYQFIRAAKDSNGRPYLNIVDDCECLFGKRVLISPSLSATAGSKGIVFGDLSHFIVRLSSLKINRKTQAAGYVEYGQALYTATQRVDSTVFDPSGGSAPAIVYATLHS